MTRLQGPRPWALCSLGQGIYYIHFCRVGACADMGNYKEHVGSPARCHVLYCKVSCMGAVEHHREWSGKLQRCVGCLFLGK